ncbi:MAG: hypothetical protein ABI955_13030, partial [Nitrospirota bacterium]
HVQGVVVSFATLWRRLRSSITNPGVTLRSATIPRPSRAPLPTAARAAGLADHLWGLFPSH